jgi:uncharacterized protein
MKRLLSVLVFLLAFGGGAFAYTFPALTGRVVDDAHLLSGDAQATLQADLAALEQETTDQLVVVTMPSLQGGSIEDFGYQLGRAWGIGQKDKNNGALLIVAPAEHKVRLEVGYGLEGTLTDAISEQIIQTIILPDFRAGKMQQGVIDGTEATIAVLGGHTLPASAADGTKAHSLNIQTAMVVLWILFILLRIFILPWWFPLIFPSRSGFGGGGFGSGSGGGFSGGGGSFGGGGASGGW